METNREDFLKELEGLCVKHNMTIFAGMFGLKFRNTSKDGLIDTGAYYNQNTETKEFIKNPTE